MWVSFGVVFDGFRGAAVGVSFTEDRIYGRAEDFSVTGACFLFGVAGWGFWKIWDGVAFCLELSDGGFELRNGGRDVRQFDDVRLRLEREGAEFGEVIRCARDFRELREDAAGEGDVTRFDRDAGVFRECLDDRQQRVGCECRGFVRLGVDDGRCFGHNLVILKGLRRDYGMRGEGSISHGRISVR